MNVATVWTEKKEREVTEGREERKGREGVFMSTMSQVHFSPPPKNDRKKRSKIDPTQSLPPFFPGKIREGRSRISRTPMVTSATRTNMCVRGSERERDRG